MLNERYQFPLTNRRPCSTSYHDTGEDNHFYKCVRQARLFRGMVQYNQTNETRLPSSPHTSHNILDPLNGIRTIASQILRRRYSGRSTAPAAGKIGMNKNLLNQYFISFRMIHSLQVASLHQLRSTKVSLSPSVFFVSLDDSSLSRMADKRQRDFTISYLQSFTDRWRT